MRILISFILPSEDSQSPLFHEMDRPAFSIQKELGCGQQQFSTYTDIKVANELRKIITDRNQAHFELRTLICPSREIEETASLQMVR